MITDTLEKQAYEMIDYYSYHPATCPSKVKKLGKSRANETLIDLIDNEEKTDVSKEAVDILLKLHPYLDGVEKLQSWNNT
ncbi:hypothetical protein GOV06_03480 [Candidatus Woesearchaeota archaeon]|nr:hypothetical protein [Candidatus Woesearchaeota archaeon]